MPKLHVSPIDLRLQVVAAALEPGLALGRIMALPLEDLQALVTIGYYRSARERGLSLRQIALRFQKSLRSVASIAKLSRDARPLLESSSRITQRRRIVERIAAREAASPEDLCAALPELPEDEACAAIEQLVAEGILTRADDGLLRVAVAHVDLVQGDADHRLDSLRHFLRAVTQTIYRRFFACDPPEAAFARVLTFRASPTRLRELRDAHYEELRARVMELDAGSEHDDAAVQASVTLSFVELPDDHFWRPRPKG
jgi:hypothetical protein